MKQNDFLNTIISIAKDYKTQYKLGGIGEHSGDLWYFDCVGIIKSVLWGWCGDTNYSRGGAIYKSNGVPDVGANDMFNKYCYDKSTDFTKIEIGELVWMDGHIGTYIGNGQVVESTVAWENKVLISNVDSKGRRTYNGRQVYSWTHHGKCQFIDYTKPTYQYNVGDKVVLNGYVHTSNEKDSECIGGYIENYIGKIADIKDGEYPYYIENLGWCREKYLTLYTGEDYEELYKKELLINKDLEKQVENLQNKINKAMEDLK